MDKYKDDGIILAKGGGLESCQEVMDLADKDSELLNNVYREISENLGMDVAISIYKMFKGQQITFPTRLFNPKRIRNNIIQEYDGTNIKMLATKYDYSEKTIRRIIKQSLE